MGDKEIIEGLRIGDNEAYRDLYARHYNTLCIYAAKIVGESYKAQAIVNDVIFSLWQNRSQLHIQNLRAYLLRAVRNRSLNALAEDRRRGSLHVSLPESDDGVWENRTNEVDYTPLDHLLAKELDVKIVASIDAMPAQTKHIFLLSRSADLKYQDIAKKLGISVDVVKYHVKQALYYLRADLKEYFFKKNNK